MESRDPEIVRVWDLPGSRAGVACLLLMAVALTWGSIASLFQLRSFGDVLLCLLFLTAGSLLFWGCWKDIRMIEVNSDGRLVGRNHLQRITWVIDSQSADFSARTKWYRFAEGDETRLDLRAEGRQASFYLDHLHPADRVKFAEAMKRDNVDVSEVLLADLPNRRTSE